MASSAPPPSVNTSRMISTSTPLPSDRDSDSDFDEDNNIDNDNDERQLRLLIRAIIEQKIRPPLLRSDVSSSLSFHLRSLLLGPALPLNKRDNFIRDILNDDDLMADAEIFVESLEGCPPGLIERNRRDEKKRGRYPAPDALLRVSEDVLRNVCVAMVDNFAEKKGVTDKTLRKKASEEFYQFYVTTILERRPKEYNSYTGLTAIMGDVKFLKRSEDIVLFGLGLLEELPEDSTAPDVRGRSAPPPMHTLGMYGLIVSTCLWMLPSLESIDEFATVETFTKSIFKEGVFSFSPLALGIVRIGFAIICAVVTAAKYRKGVDFQLTYLPQSKLRRGQLQFTGWKTQGFYTSWAWNLLGCSFLLGGIIPLLDVAGRQDVLDSHPWILRAALISFEIAAPSAFLTSTVVTFALWPRAYKTHGASGTTGFKGWINQFQHNVNTAMVLMEVCLMGGLPVKLSHAAIAPLFGLVYQSFLWGMTNRWSPKQGPVFIYFFMDTTLGWKTTVFMAVLLFVMLFFYVLFALLDMGMERMEEAGCGVFPNLCCVGWLSFLLMKFKD
mmetsp:Transcript_16880/g.34364  ORF Transcript_16880/g.34364 Transcript_16880/m.34364 type:complete len:554 (-) Transcript_16880:114-1775(-)